MAAYWFIATVFLILAGVIAAAGIIAKKRPNAKELIDKLVPYQGWIGLVLLVLALIDFILLLVAIGDMTGTRIGGRTYGGASGMQWVTWALYLTASVVGLGLGFLLGFGLVSKILAAAKEAGETDAPSEETASEEGASEVAATVEPVGEALYLKLQSYQSPLGLAGIALGLLSVIFGIIWMPASPTFMGVILFILMILAGGLAAATLITKKMPEASGILKCMESSKGAMGIAVLVWGLLNLIYTLRLVTLIRGSVWVWWVFSMLASLVAVALGFLLGFALLKRFVLSGEGEAAEAAEVLRKKLAGMQVLLGLAAMLLGLLHFIFTLVWC